MPLSESEYKALVIKTVGDTAEGLIGNQLELLWAIYESTTDLYLRYLYVSRKAIDLLAAHIREQVSFTNTIAGNQVTVDLKQKFANLQTMRATVQAEITAREQAAAAAAEQPASGARIGQMHKTAPTMCINGINPNDRRFR